MTRTGLRILRMAADKTTQRRDTSADDVNEPLAHVRRVVTRSGTSFLWGMKVLPAERRHAMYAIYAFCREVDDVADEPGETTAKKRGLADWREEIARLYAGKPQWLTTRALLQPVRRFDLPREEFLAVIDGVETDAAPTVRMQTLDDLLNYCRKVAGAVGMLSIHAFGVPRDPGYQIAETLGNAVQLTNILRDVKEDAAMETPVCPAGHGRATRCGGKLFGLGLQPTRLCRGVRGVGGTRSGRLRQDRPAAGPARMASDAPHRVDDGGLPGNAPAPGRTGLDAHRQSGPADAGAKVVARPALRASLTGLLSVARAHVIGAGLAGLATAVSLARVGQAVTLYEASGQAGGRCRSYFDAKLDCAIDNGNHLLLTGNQATMRYLADIGADDELVGPPSACFPFLDLGTGAQWRLRPNAGRLPWWILDARRRVPGTRVRDYLSGLRFAVAGADRTVTDCVGDRGVLFEKFWEPLAVAALNSPVRTGAACLLWPVLRETFGKGEAACRPRVARTGLSGTFVDPALELLRRGGTAVRFGTRLRGIVYEGTRGARRAVWTSARKRWRWRRATAWSWRCRRRPRQAWCRT